MAAILLSLRAHTRAAFLAMCVCHCACEGSDEGATTQTAWGHHSSRTQLTSHEGKIVSHTPHAMHSLSRSSGDAPMNPAHWPSDNPFQRLSQRMAMPQSTWQGARRNIHDGEATDGVAHRDGDVNICSPVRRFGRSHVSQVS